MVFFCAFLGKIEKDRIETVWIKDVNTKVTSAEVLTGACSRQMFSNFNVESEMFSSFVQMWMENFQNVGQFFRKGFNFCYYVENLESPKNKLF